MLDNRTAVRNHRMRTDHPSQNWMSGPFRHSPMPDTRTHSWRCERTTALIDGRRWKMAACDPTDLSDADLAAFCDDLWQRRAVAKATMDAVTQGRLEASITVVEREIGRRQAGIG